MGKQEESKNKKNEKIINTAFRIFVEKKIEPVSITEIAEKAVKPIKRMLEISAQLGL